jgi:hypothetical protein
MDKHPKVEPASQDRPPGLTALTDAELETVSAAWFNRWRHAPLGSSAPLASDHQWDLAPLRSSTPRAFRW